MPLKRVGKEANLTKTIKKMVFLQKISEPLETLENYRLGFMGFYITTGFLRAFTLCFTTKT